MRNARHLAWLIAVLLAVGLFGLGIAKGGFGPTAAGEPAPDYAAVSIEGDTVAIADLRGRVVLLNVWATWCLPCVTEMPALQRLHARLADSGLSVVAVSIDVAGFGRDPIAHVREFVEDYGLTFTVLHDASGTIDRQFAVHALPVTFIIDRDGRIIERVLGGREWDEPEHATRIEELLAH